MPNLIKQIKQIQKCLKLLKMATQTIITNKPQGYFIPHRYANKIARANNQKCYHNVKTILAKQKPQLVKTIKTASLTLNQLKAYCNPSNNPLQPRFNQSWFPRLDAIIAYSMITANKPNRIIEIGCGHSTRFIAQALQDHSITAELHAIDPHPRASLKGLPNVIWHADYVQNLSVDFFTQLNKGDVLFIDSSHILLSGSDVDFLLNGVLPCLAKGVLVHIHDIFLPDDYPEDWLWRGYNEQSGVAILLGSGGSGGYDVLWSSHYALQACSRELEAFGLLDFPLLAESHENSLWLVKL